MSDNLIRNPGQIKFWKGNTQMSLTFQILSWHRIYKGKTKQHQKKKKKSSLLNIQTEPPISLYCVKQEADTKLRDNAHQPAWTLPVVSAAMRNNVQFSSSTLFQK